jgi:hypothetical protein
MSSDVEFFVPQTPMTYVFVTWTGQAINKSRGWFWDFWAKGMRDIDKLPVEIASALDFKGSATKQMRQVAA